MIDWQAELYDTLYAEFGMPGVLSIDGSFGGDFTVSAIDKTAGEMIEASAGGGFGIQVQTLRPCARIRFAEFTALGLDRADLDGAGFLLNGKGWLVKSHALHPGPFGENTGEIQLILIAEDES